MEERRRSSVDQLERDAEAAVVAAWRLNVLLRAGYPQSDAHALARLPYVDLHRAVELVARGCPADTAVRILI